MGEILSRRRRTEGEAALKSNMRQLLVGEAGIKKKNEMVVFKLLHQHSKLTRRMLPKSAGFMSPLESRAHKNKKNKKLWRGEGHSKKATWKVIGQTFYKRRFRHPLSTRITGEKTYQKTFTPLLTSSRWNRLEIKQFFKCSGWLFARWAGS